MTEDLLTPQLRSLRTQVNRSWKRRLHPRPRRWIVTSHGRRIRCGRWPARGCWGCTSPGDWEARRKDFWLWRSLPSSSAARARHRRLCFGMHCAGTAVIAAKATAAQEESYLRPMAGRHITTLALSESGSGALTAILRKRSRWKKCPCRTIISWEARGIRRGTSLDHHALFSDGDGRDVFGDRAVCWMLPFNTCVRVDTRIQGKPWRRLRSFNIECGEMWAAVQKTRSLIFDSTRLGDLGDPHSLPHILACKAEAGETAVPVANEAMTLCGDWAYSQNSYLARMLATPGPATSWPRRPTCCGNGPAALCWGFLYFNIVERLLNVRADF